MRLRRQQELIVRRILWLASRRQPHRRKLTVLRLDAMSGRVCLRIRDEEREGRPGTACRSPKALQNLALHIGG